MNQYIALLSYKANNSSRFFFEALFTVIINMPHPLMEILELDKWKQNPLFIMFIKCLPLSLNDKPILQKFKEPHCREEANNVEIFTNTIYQPMPLLTLSSGSTGYYFNNMIDFIE